MNVKSIKTEEGYNAALERSEVIFDANPSTPKEDEVEILIERYENEHYPIDLPDPIEAIKFRMEQIGYTQSDLAEIIRLKSRANEMRNRKRKLSLERIRQRHKALNMPTDVLVQVY